MTVLPVVRIALYCTLVRTFPIRASSKGGSLTGAYKLINYPVGFFPGPPRPLSRTDTLYGESLS